MDKPFKPITVFISLLILIFALNTAPISATGIRDYPVLVEPLIQNRIMINDVGSLVAAVASMGFVIAAVLIFIYIVWGGLEWILGGGEKEKITNARNRITQGIIGLAIVAMAWVIFLLLRYFFGLTGINIIGGGGGAYGCGTAGASTCMSGQIYVCDGSTWRPTGQQCP